MFPPPLASLRRIHIGLLECSPNILSSGGIEVSNADLIASMPAEIPLVASVDIYDIKDSKEKTESMAAGFMD